MVDIITILLTAAALGFVGWEMRELRFHLRINTYMEYTRRYSEILTGFPSKVFEDCTYSLEDCLVEEPEFKTSARRNFWLLQVDLFLQQGRLLPKDQWRIWEQEFVHMLELACLRQVWQQLRKEVVYPQEFVQYVDARLAATQGGTRGGEAENGVAS